MFRTQNNRVESEQLVKRVVKFYKRHCQEGFEKDWLHFKEEGVPKTTVYRCSKIYGESVKVELKKSPGPTPTIATPQRLKTLFRRFLLFRWCCGEEVQNGWKILEPN